MPNPSMAAAIVGAAESNKIGYIEEGTTATLLHIEAIANVCKQIGIKPSEIEGIFSTNFSPQLAEHLGIHPKYMDTTAVGGCSFLMHVHHALAAIYAGIIDVALISHGEAPTFPGRFSVIYVGQRIRWLGASAPCRGNDAKVRPFGDKSGPSSAVVAVNWASHRRMLHSPLASHRARSLTTRSRGPTFR